MTNHSFCSKGSCFIVPPHILEHVASNADQVELRKQAMHNLLTQGQFRGMRTIMSQFAFAGLGTGTKRRTIYDAINMRNLPGKLVRSEEHAASDDIAVNEAYDFTGYTYDFFQTLFKRNSLNNKGFRLDSTVHYGNGYQNAFWDGQQMVYGDGDGQLFERFTKCIDVIGHELTHGVTQFTAALEYLDQPGALNESMSDVFGTLIKQYVLKQTVQQADWLIGAGLFVPQAGSNRAALRSMKAPGTAYDDRILGKDPQPAHMKDYYNGSYDNGGVHINSGILNHAFYLAAMEIGGYAWEVAGKIWYEVLTARLNSQSQFSDAATAARDVAKKYGKDAAEAVDKAWKTVGL